MRRPYPTGVTRWSFAGRPSRSGTHEEHGMNPQVMRVSHAELLVRTGTVRPHRFSSSVTLRWADRRSLRLVRWAHQRSTRSRQEELVGVKVQVEPGVLEQPLVDGGGLLGAVVSDTKCRSRSLGPGVDELEESQEPLRQCRRCAGRTSSRWPGRRQRNCWSCRCARHHGSPAATLWAASPGTGRSSPAYGSLWMNRRSADRFMVCTTCGLRPQGRHIHEITETTGPLQRS